MGSSLDRAHENGLLGPHTAQHHLPVFVEQTPAVVIAWLEGILKDRFLRRRTNPELDASGRIRSLLLRAALPEYADAWYEVTEWVRGRTNECHDFMVSDAARRSTCLLHAEIAEKEILLIMRPKPNESKKPR
ncbi:MAG: hypothetical protein U0487_04045 [Patescibacteria group bacterium]